MVKWQMEWRMENWQRYKTQLWLYINVLLCDVSWKKNCIFLLSSKLSEPHKCTYGHRSIYISTNLYTEGSNCICIHNKCLLKILQRVGVESHPRHPHLFPYDHSIRTELTLTHGLASGKILQYSTQTLSCKHLRFSLFELTCKLTDAEKSRISSVVCPHLAALLHIQFFLSEELT